jgi:methanogenic corrinoid protein MtbC1
MENEILDNLAKAVKEFSAENAAKWAEKAMEEKLDALKAMDALTGAIRDIGDAFGRGEVFLPELLGAADAMQGAMPILEADLEKKSKKWESAGRVVAGTVAGDIHNIGKSILCTLLKADGFEVIDLGIDVSVDSFLTATKQNQPHIIAMSALLTITAAEQRKVIQALEKEGIRSGIKVIVGGAAISEQFAESIGADGYESTALGGVKLAKSLLAA